jgi:hypothetical protein
MHSVSQEGPPLLGVWWGQDHRPLHVVQAMTWITRSQWGARSPRSSSRLSNPQGSTAHWEGPHMGDFPHSECPDKVRSIQSFHMNQRGWSDIAYTTVVCPHGDVFEGRGWYRRTAANGTNAGNNASYAHCYLGGQGDGLTEAGKAGIALAFQLGVEQGGAGTKQWVHRDWKATECPGTEIVNFVRAGLPAQESEEDEMSQYAEQLNRIESRLDKLDKLVAIASYHAQIARRNSRGPLRRAIIAEFEDRGLEIETPTETAVQRVDRIATELEFGHRTWENFLASLDGIVERNREAIQELINQPRHTTSGTGFRV